MVEIKPQGENLLSQSFAGDVYNSAVYLKRNFPDVESCMVTAVGSDKLSEKMLSRFNSEKLNTTLVFKHADKAPGMYLIATDENGERSFTYWRNDSAAKQIMSFIDQVAVNQLSKGDMFFFSGISLAVIEESARSAFWELLTTLKEAGVKIVFDPNYRPRLWRNEEQAKQAFQEAFHLSNIVLPGVEDLTTLFGITTSNGVIAFFKSYGMDEIVVKNGPESVVILEKGKTVSYKITPVEKVIDTTSAGDAFNGSYLGARLSGFSTTDAVSVGAKAAAIVIQHPGAIVPKEKFIQAMTAH